MRPVSRMRAHDRMRDRRHLGLLLRRQRVLAVAARAREIEIVDGVASLDRRPDRGGQQLVGGIHVGEFGFAAFARHDLRIHHGGLAGALLPGAVGVPKERAAIRMLAARIAVLVEVGQHVDFRVLLVAVILAEHVDLHLAEIAREGDLGRRRQIDVAEQDQLVVEKGFIDLLEQRRRHRLRQRDAGDLAAKHRMQRRDLERPIAARALRFKLGLGHDHLPAGSASRRLCQRRRALPIPKSGTGFRKIMLK